MPASPLANDDADKGEHMRLLRNKAHPTVTTTALSMTRSQASQPGPDGDGKEHDLQYWLDSGFLALPKDPGRTGM